MGRKFPSSKTHYLRRHYRVWRSSPHATAPTSDPVSTRGRPSVQRKGSVGHGEEHSRMAQTRLLPPSLLRIHNSPQRVPHRLVGTWRGALPGTDPTSWSEEAPEQRQGLREWLVRQMCHT